MSYPTEAWQNLIPSELPSKYLKIWFSEVDLVECLASFDFAGFVHLDEHNGGPRFKPGRPESYCDPFLATKVAADKNHYSMCYTIDVDTTNIVFMDYCMGEWGNVSQQTAVQLLKYLIVDFALSCQWHAWAMYWDSGEESEIWKGTEKELRALYAETSQTL